ncbi:hypothetical protein E2C01_092481 [Portunus trituberculatus]|uniref:Uncharacterized protein n=1 Tax=Portunus trituberculatus TaxID=210409 RepID=A0A5B7JM26_PORTR|nr:hypothetical protein [Portunus trituberculatus]
MPLVVVVVVVVVAMAVIVGLPRATPTRKRLPHRIEGPKPLQTTADFSNFPHGSFHPLSTRWGGGKAQGRAGRGRRAQNLNLSSSGTAVSLSPQPLSPCAVLGRDGVAVGAQGGTPAHSLFPSDLPFFHLW